MTQPDEEGILFFSEHAETDGTVICQLFLLFFFVVVRSSTKDEGLFDFFVSMAGFRLKEQGITNHF